MCTVVIPAGKGVEEEGEGASERFSDAHRRLLRDKNIHQRNCDSYDQYTAIYSVH